MDSWKKSRTTMIPKVKKPTAAQLRPIALTDISYKLYMTIQGRKIDNHIIDNNEQIETQAGFTKGGQIEDNLFILQYCTEKTYKQRKPLIVTCIDYTKAYDSIKRETIVETLTNYRIQPKIIDTIATIYEHDSTTINIGERSKHNYWNNKWNSTRLHRINHAIQIGNLYDNRKVEPKRRRI